MILSCLLLLSSFTSAIRDVGSLPVAVDYSKTQIEEIFSEFVRGEKLNEASATLATWSSEFFASECATPWQKSNYRFGIFGGEKSTHKKTRLIQGINCKMCFEYCDWILENKKEELKKLPYLERLVRQLIDLDRVCHAAFLDKMDEIAQTHPKIASIFYTYKGEQRLPISLRLIRFDKSEQFALPLHFDISVMSLIFPSDDPPLEENLVIAPADGSVFTVEQLKRALRPSLDDPNQSCALMISGTLLSHLNIPILPTPHGVLPQHRDFRCVIVACLHIPNLDTSEQSTLLPTLNEIPAHLIKSPIPPTTRSLDGL